MTRGEDGETVADFEVKVSVFIRAWDQEGSTLYDWISDAGESDDLFETIADAKASALSSLGG